MQNLKKLWNINDVNYGKKIAKRVKKKINILRTIFIALNILILAIALVTAIFAIYVTAFLAAKLPSWYPYLTAGIGAGTTFITSLINFFIISDKIKKNEVIYNKILMELNRYQTKLVKKYEGANNKWHLFVALEAILGNDAAKAEAINE